ncbi:hypothetical protein JXB41_08010 [Candidatus Woesearchaeota archaeon]|nr:hypothetical protein [Candidatus Woesearchaeota archaeon]
MIKQIIDVFRLVFGQVRSMSDIPGVVWCFVGILVSAVSFFTAFIRKAEKPFMFYLTLAIGVGMFIYGIVKTKRMRKKTDEELDKKIEQSNLRRENFNIETEAQHPKSTGAFARATQGPAQHYSRPAQHAAHHKTSTHHTQQRLQATHSKRFCHNCGAPITGHHRFCSNCGSRL